jgi:hypothetical protein
MHGETIKLIIFTVVLNYIFNVTLKTRFCITEISILKQNTFCVILLFYGKRV